MGNELLTGFLAGQSDNNSGNNGGGFFGNEGLWAVIILAIIFGWGNNGNGFGSRNGGGNGGDNVTVVPYPAPGCYGGFGGYPTEAVLQRALDTQTIISKLDGNTQGLCDGFYAQSNAINGLGTTIMQTAAQAELAECNRQAILMQQLHQMGYNQQDCCCQIKSAIGDVKYQMAADTCDIKTSIRDVGRDIIDNQNANYRGLMDFMVQSKMEALQAENQTLKLEKSQAAQNGYIDAIGNSIVARLQQPQPVPSYQVPAPYPYCVPQTGGCDCGGNRCC